MPTVRTAPTAPALTVLGGGDKRNEKNGEETQEPSIAAPATWADVVKRGKVLTKPVNSAVSRSVLSRNNPV